jgi:2-polyprenyl-6-hydroxyphenyl methylase/3-demethylubiquinone-9 3-methyltransferase
MAAFQSLKKIIAIRTYRLLYVVFYQMIFGKRMPFAEKLATVVCSYEKRQKRGDIPVAREVWEAQYLAGRWDYMEQVDELARYSMVIGFLQYFTPGGAILDVGCGEGILFRRYRFYEYTKYVGIDISEAAIKKISQENNERAVFITANAETYTPTEHFDSLVFNEVLYYFNDPFSTLEKYTNFLNRDGIFIISTYTDSKRAMSILNRIKSTYRLLTEVTTTQGSRSWVCSVFLPPSEMT